MLPSHGEPARPRTGRARPARWRGAAARGLRCSMRVGAHCASYIRRRPTHRGGRGGSSPARPRRVWHLCGAAPHSHRADTACTPPPKKISRTVSFFKTAQTRTVCSAAALRPHRIHVGPRIHVHVDRRAAVRVRQELGQVRGRGRSVVATKARRPAQRAFLEAFPVSAPGATAPARTERAVVAGLPFETRNPQRRRALRRLGGARRPGPAQPSAASHRGSAVRC